MLLEQVFKEVKLEVTKSNLGSDEAIRRGAKVCVTT